MGEGSWGPRWLRASLLAVAVLLAVPAVAEAYNIGGQRWPGTPARIAYYDATRDRCAPAVARAAKEWNTSGARLRWVEVSRPAKADLRITGGRGPGYGGYASIGYQWFNFIEVAGCSRRGTEKRVTTAVLVHEMGHVIGLDHVGGTRCAPVMIPVSWMDCYEPPKPWLDRCRFLYRDDVAGAVKRYGGKVDIPRKLWCDLVPPPAEVANPTVEVLTVDPSELAEVSFSVTSDSIRKVAVDRWAGTCSRIDFRFETIFNELVDKGDTHTFVDADGDWEGPFPSGTYCYRFTSVGKYDRKTAVKILVDYPGTGAPSAPARAGARTGLCPDCLANPPWEERPARPEPPRIIEFDRAG